MKNLKKVFEPKSSSNKALVREQMEILSTRNSIDCQSIYRSIEVRALVITHQILNKAKNKDLNTVDIESIKDQVSVELKKIKAMRKKHDEIENTIFGISDKDIKLNLKYSKGRKPDKELLKKVKLYLIDPSKIIKDDKTLKPAKAKFMKKGEKKKPEASMFSETFGQSELNDMAVTIGEDGLPIENMEEMDMEGEGMDGDMEGMEAMEGEGEEKEGDEEKEDDEDDKNDGSAAQLEGAGDEVGASLGPSDSTGALKKKRGSVSKSPKKGKKKVDDDKVELVNWKASTKTKGKLIVSDKVANPPHILEYIIANFEEGIDSLDVAKLKAVIHELYIKPERKKLAFAFEIKKSIPTIAQWQKMVIHMAYNIGPRKNLNDDIDEIKEDEEEKGSDEEDLERGEGEEDEIHDMNASPAMEREDNASPDYFEINDVIGG